MLDCGFTIEINAPWKIKTLATGVINLKETYWESKIMWFIIDFETIATERPYESQKPSSLKVDQPKIIT